MKKTLEVATVSFLSSATFFYALFSFVRWSLYIGDWSQETRIGYAMLVGITTLFVSLGYHANKTGID